MALALRFCQRHVRTLVMRGHHLFDVDLFFTFILTSQSEVRG
jgi:hypothetical protein